MEMTLVLVSALLERHASSSPDKQSLDIKELFKDFFAGCTELRRICIRIGQRAGTFQWATLVLSSAPPSLATVILRGPLHTTEEFEMLASVFNCKRFPHLQVVCFCSSEERRANTYIGSVRADLERIFSDMHARGILAIYEEGIQRRKVRALLSGE